MRGEWSKTFPRLPPCLTYRSQYKQVPTLRKDDNVIPPAKDISAFLTSLRHPRKRTVSIGPQSEADAREYIAQRTKRRSLESIGSEIALTQPLVSPMEEGEFTFDAVTSNIRQRSKQNLEIPGVTAGTEPSSLHSNDEHYDKAMFLALEKPRVRYDVEVVTKLVVYAGMLRQSYSLPYTEQPRHRVARSGGRCTPIRHLRLGCRTCVILAKGIVIDR